MEMSGVKNKVGYAKDWLQFKLGDLIDFKGGSQPPRFTFIFSPKEGYVRLLQIRDYKSDKYATYIPISLAKNSCSPDDIMIGRYGPPIFQILKGLSGAYNVALIKAQPNDKLNNTYGYYFLKQDKLLEFVEKLSQRSSGQTGIDLQELKNYPFPLPPTFAEQSAIATTLSDADALITSLEKLIAKKRNIKQGAMQKLLKPRKSWEVKSLGEVSDLTSSKRIFENEYVKNGIPFYRGKEISLLNKNKRIGEEYFISEQRYNEIKNVFGAPKKDEILITAVGTLGNVYLIPDNSKFYFKDGNLIWLRNIRNILPAFLEIQINWLKDEIINNAIGSSQKALTIVVLNKQSVAYPNSISEQQAIISILKDMDSDILTLESKLEKYRQIKSGMMQNLLTGKIRLI